VGGLDVERRRSKPRRAQFVDGRQPPPVVFALDAIVRLDVGEIAQRRVVGME
jgi:hypothetical protein